MILLVDVGNTRIKWATLENEELKFGDAFNYHEKDFTPLLNAQWSQLLSPQRIMIANVAGADVEKNLLGWIKQFWHKIPEFITPQAQQNGVVNGYIDPKTLGVDRWLSLIAARNSYSGPVCIISCGTAITIDAMNATGQHLGGLITPGLEAMRSCLTKCTPLHLPTNEFGQQEKNWLGKCTEEGVSQGILFMTTAFINQSVKQLQVELGSELICVISGGDAELFLSRLSTLCHYRPFLVLDGLTEFSLSSSQ